MGSFGLVMLLATAPAIGTLLGGLLARRVTLSKDSLSLVLHLAGGVVLGVVGVELMPRALEAEPLLVLVTFFAGGVTYIVTTRGSEWVSTRVPIGPSGGSSGAIIAGVGFDMLTDGMMIAAGQRTGEGLGLLLAVGLFVADTPEAFSTVATLKSQEVGSRLVTASVYLFPALVLLGAPLGYVTLLGRPDWVELAVLAFTAGMLVLVVIEGLVPEAHQLSRRESEKASVTFLAGFTAFAAISLYIG